MLDKMQATLVRSLSKHIHLSQREVTILFTDIEDSTRYWGNRGNVQGRLMVDRHNRIILPIIRHFHGKVVKTIGDSVMAMFYQPDDAARAAIAIQQALQQAREHDREFRINVRIGLHIGDAVVEHNDVYGDVVNVAARIESKADGGEILFSGRLARRLERTEFRRSKKGGFTPKGKHQRIALYRCDWQQHDDLVVGLTRNPLMPVGGHQRIEVAAYLVVLLYTILFLYQHYVRYLLNDFEAIALLSINPLSMLQHYWYLALISVLMCTALVWRVTRVNIIPYRVLKALKGAALAGISFMVLHSLGTSLQLSEMTHLGNSIYDSEHLLVEVITDSATLHSQPNQGARTIMKVNRGALLLLSDVQRVDDTVWNKVLVDKEQYGWIERVVPPRMGAAEQRISWTDKFTLRYLDIYLLLLSLPAFYWGYRSFRIRPI